MSHLTQRAISAITFAPNQPVTTTPAAPELSRSSAKLASSDSSHSLASDTMEDVNIPFLWDRERRFYSFDALSVPLETSISYSPRYFLDNSLTAPKVTLDSPPENPRSLSTETSSSNYTSSSANTPNSNNSHTEVTLSTYPTSLPPPYLIDHLVDLFFSSIPYSNRILHRPSFMAALRELPGSRKYPSTALLHAICANSSLFSPLVEKPILRARPAHEIFVSAQALEEEHGLALGQRIGFTLEQAVLARAMIELDIRVGNDIIMSVTALSALCWYYVSAPS